MEEIIRGVTPLIERIVSRYAHAEGSVSREDAEDVIATVQLRLVARLRSEEPIERIEDYVATLTYNTLHDHLRRRYPQRTRLKNRLRYVLTRDGRLSLWQGRAGLMAGLKEREGAGAPPFPPRIEEATRTMRNAARPADAVHEILSAAGGVMAFDALVELTASLWNISDAPATAVLEHAAPEREDARAASEIVARLWREIGRLPVPQRRALLLNLRHGDAANAIELFAFTGTASFAEIAATLEMTAGELAAIWNDLPLPDKRIAGMLGLTRQQVINLRMSARKRLAHRVLDRKGER